MPIEKLELFQLDTLIELVPGSTRRRWLGWIPDLVATGILVKRGRGWLGRRAAIEAALTTVDRSTP